MDNTWLKTHTFHHSDFSDIGRLVKLKERKNVSISLCFPTLNEEKTIAKEIIIMKSELMTRYPLLDEIVVIDSGSTDRTVEIAGNYGADVHLADNILPRLMPFKGKGENLWKALYITKSDIIVYLDADIKNIHHRFAYGLVGPLLVHDHIKYSKAFYERPIAGGERQFRPSGGGRVTELVVRPLFSLYFPELTQIIQPISGEYAGYREIFEKLPFPIGYGIETSMIFDIYEKWGLNIMAQVDLDRRVHRNQSTTALGRMAFAILNTFFSRMASRKMIEMHQQTFNEMIQYNIRSDTRQPRITKFSGYERPPIIQIPEYRAKFEKGKAGASEDSVSRPN